MQSRSSGFLLAAACAAMLAACVVAPVQPPAAPVAAPAPVTELNVQSIAGEPDTGGFLEPGVQVLAQDGGMSDAAVARAIASKLRANLVLPRGSFPRTASVTLEAMLTPRGAVLGARVSRSSGFKAVDEAVLKALRRAEPLPVTQAMIDSDSLQRIALVFRPFQ